MLKYHCGRFLLVYNSLLYLQGGPKVRIIAISVYFATSFSLGSLIKIIVDFLNLIYFATCEARQKPDKHYVTKSLQIIIDSPFR